MSTGKRLAKRSIIGTRVSAPGDDGKYYSGVIQSIKTPGSFPETNNSINLTPLTRYSVRFDIRQGLLGRRVTEFLETQLIGPGFNSVIATQLAAGQKAYVTYNNREVAGEVSYHDPESDVVIIRICPPGCEIAFEVQKRLEEVRLLESRKSARLSHQDTDFARLADMSCDRKRAASQSIDVPIQQNTNTHRSRKRRPSDEDEDESPNDSRMDECRAALVLMSLSASPLTTNVLADMSWIGTSPESSSSASSCRLSPSPPPRDTASPNAAILSSSSASDEGIGMDFLYEMPRKKKTIRRIVFQCTWPGCQIETNMCETIEAHVRKDHLNCDKTNDREEEFYYTEREVNESSPPPTLSHRDMARPPHEDPEYQRLLVGCYRQQMLTGPINIPQSPHKLPKLSARPHSPKTPASPRRARGESKKCRKIYGMDHKDMWCTQCKWKKACSRFGE